MLDLTVFNEATITTAANIVAGITPATLSAVYMATAAILILLVMPFIDLGRSRGLQFRPLSKIAFFIFVANFLILMQIKKSE